MPNPVKNHGGEKTVCLIIDLVRRAGPPKRRPKRPCTTCTKTAVFVRLSRQKPWPSQNPPIRRESARNAESASVFAEIPARTPKSAEIRQFRRFPAKSDENRESASVFGRNSGPDAQFARNWPNPGRPTKSAERTPFAPICTPFAPCLHLEYCINTA